MSTNEHSGTTVPVNVDRVDQLVGISRDLAGFVLILDAAATGDPTLAAVERILGPINESLQDFKSWFHDAWHTSAGAGG
jgi:hypothetical protein